MQTTTTKTTTNNNKQNDRQTLIEDGAQLILVNNIPNPFKQAGADRRRKYSSRFEHTLNKLYIWNMTQYERVIFLDSV